MPPAVSTTIVMLAAALITAVLIAAVILRTRAVSEGPEQVRILAEHVVEMVSTHDPDGTFRYVAPVFAGLLGEYPGTLVRKHPKDFAHPEDTTVVAALCKRALAWSGTTATAIWRCRRYDGSYVWLETTARASTNEIAALGPVVCASRDITERKQIEDALRYSEQRFRTALETVRFIAVGLDAQGNITFCNDALTSLTGYTRAELLGESWFGKLAAPNSEFREDFFSNIVAGTIQTHNESEIVCRDGTRRLIEWDNTVLRMPSGSVMGTASLGIDVTERKRYEKQLLSARDAAESASRAKSEFLSRMSHELRTPLNSVIGFANVLRKNRGGNLTDEDLGYLDRITANGRHLLSLVNDVLDIAKVESGRLVVSTGPVAIDQLVTQVVAQLEGTPREPGVVLKAEVPARMTPITSDEALLRQVLINLTSNALRFTHEGSVVVLAEADASGQPTRISVRDTGIGISPDRQEAIFEPFEQADSSTHAIYGGTGLGLSISRAICEALGYRMTLESKPGKGSTFMVDLRPAPAKRPTPVTNIADSAEGDGKTTDTAASRLI